MFSEGEVSFLILLFLYCFFQKCAIITDKYLCAKNQSFFGADLKGVYFHESGFDTNAGSIFPC